RFRILEADDIAGLERRVSWLGGGEQRNGRDDEVPRTTPSHHGFFPLACSNKRSQPRAVSAIIVSVGCLSPVDGKALPPNTYRFAMSCVWQNEFRTPSFGFTLIRAVPTSWIDPPSGRRRPALAFARCGAGPASGARGPPGKPAGAVTGPGKISPPALRNSSSAFCWKSSISL